MRRISCSPRILRSDEKMDSGAVPRLSTVLLCRLHPVSPACPLVDVLHVSVCFQNAEVNLASLEGDLAFLKDQITISEVNIARVHNFNVQVKKEAKEREVGSQPQISKMGKMQAAGTIPGPL